MRSDVGGTVQSRSDPKILLVQTGTSGIERAARFRERLPTVASTFAGLRGTAKRIHEERVRQNHRLVVRRQRGGLQVAKAAIS
jgi:hypothetical protein